ncbi:MAG: prepilin-type N-terminal cleavage/methylation domain-containing protein [Gemmatimonadaceae bacterium]|nr:prepilin-type N-terminal cleavage/methylation domain-containing protein [Gemmatimonadaceae bacterium]
MRLTRGTASGNSTRAHVRNAGFSMLEMLLVLIVLGVLATISIPRVSRIMQHERVNRAAQIVAADLQNGFAIAGRQRAPVRLSVNGVAKSYTFSDRSSGVVLQTRVMNNSSEFALSALTTDAATIDVLPNGIASTPFVITVSQGDYSRRISASTAGFVRVIPAR